MAKPKLTITDEEFLDRLLALNDNRSELARELGVSRTSLYRRLRRIHPNVLGGISSADKRGGCTRNIENNVTDGKSLRIHIIVPPNTREITVEICQGVTPGVTPGVFPYPSVINNA